jgi:hypothetical protein
MKKTLTIFTLLIIAAISSHAADIHKLVQDTQKMTQVGSTTNLVWWIPSEFWEETLRQNAQLTDEQKEEFVAALDDYSAFVIANMEIGVLGGMTFKSREEILKNVSLQVEGMEVKHIPTQELTPDAQAFYTMMKPLMGQMLGQFGQGMEFIIYPNKREGELIIDPMKEGSFTYNCFGEQNNWRLPLGSLLPPVWDPKTKEIFPGNYKFNPFTGAKLSIK